MQQGVVTPKRTTLSSLPDPADFAAAVDDGFGARAGIAIDGSEWRL
jgi:hypothetical protein